KSSQRKTSSFYEKRRLDFDQKMENDSQITIHLTLNKKDFSSSDILSICTPQEFIEKYLV
ncbi:MAG: hypothetical protein U0K71_14335, partial [Paludibacteraceae bacterium]|nr:hypothetical protein [Paludibacteraceae bacterium]